jgi:group I intron endonuclease
MADEKTGIIYLITNLVNGKQYVGQTVLKLSARWTRHKHYASKKSSGALQRAINKYGHESFAIETVCEDVPAPWLPSVEVAFIHLLGTFGHGYNLTIGGEGCSGTVHTAEQNEAHSARMRGRKLSPEHRTKISKGGVGRKPSPETRLKLQRAADKKRGMIHNPEALAKMSASFFPTGNVPWNKGITHSEETRTKISFARKGKNAGENNPMFGKPGWMLGKTFSEEHRTKLSLARTGIKLSAETRERISQVQLGKKLSPETIAKITATHIGKKRPNASSDFIGVMYDRARDKWISLVHHDKKAVWRARFSTEIEAAQAHDAKVIELKFNLPLNFPQVEVQAA